VYSDKKDWWGKAYQACQVFGIANACIIPADAPIIPSWLIKDVIYMHMTHRQPIAIEGYPVGIDVKAMPFHIIANMYRYAGFDDKQAELMADIKIKTYPVRNSELNESMYIYDGIKDLSFRSRDSAPMLDALISDIARGAELSDLLREWDEQERSI
jgi:hypothetical protein